MSLWRAGGHRTAPERTRLLYSLSKSFTSTALGFALSEGLFDLDDPVVSHFPEFAADITDAGSRSITMRHVASMASGHNRDMIQEAIARDSQEPVRGFLLTPPDQPPGTLFAYSQPCTYTVASVIQRAAGIPLSEYLRPRLFDPLGIGDVGWLTWPPGREQGFSGLFARTEDIAKLGQLYLQRGRWDEAQLLPESYVAQATSRQIDTANQENNPDWRQGYGFQFWMSRHGYRGDGAFGQFCIVLPEQDAVVAITSGTDRMQAVLDAVWEHLLPGFEQHRLEQHRGGCRRAEGSRRPPPRPEVDAVRGATQATTLAGVARQIVHRRTRIGGQPGSTAHVGQARRDGPGTRGHHRRAVQLAHLSRWYRRLAGLHPS